MVPSLYGKPQKKTVMKERQTVNNTRKQRLLLKLLKISVDPTDLIGHCMTEWKSQSLSSPLQTLSVATLRHTKGSIISSKNQAENISNVHVIYWRAFQRWAQLNLHRKTV